MKTKKEKHMLPSQEYHDKRQSLTSIFMDARELVGKGYSTRGYTLTENDVPCGHDSDDAAKWNYFTAVANAHSRRDKNIQIPNVFKVMDIMDDLYETWGNGKAWYEYTQEETIGMFDRAIVIYSLP